MSKTLRFFVLVLAQMPSCFSIRSGAKFRPHKEQDTNPSLPPPGPVAKIDLRGIVVPLAEVGGDSTITGFGANFGFVADGLVSCTVLEEDFYHRQGQLMYLLYNIYFKNQTLPSWWASDSIPWKWVVKSQPHPKHLIWNHHFLQEDDKMSLTDEMAAKLLPPLLPEMMQDKNRNQKISLLTENLKFIRTTLDRMVMAN